ncbi:MAG: type II toxin-antitoxin system RelE/ParE family toxin [Candidatus Binatia bacterium]
MKRRTVTRRPAAKTDLLEHYVFIGEENLDAADRFLAEAGATFEKLAAMPRMGRRWESEDRRLGAIRVWPMPGWKRLIFYRPGRSGIEIVRVLHAARDITAIIRDENE